MNAQTMNVFIVDENQQMDRELKQTLAKKFGKSLHISTFHTAESCLKMIDRNTCIAILVSFKEVVRKHAMLKSIKTINPKTEVIILSQNDSIESVIKYFRAGAADYVIKDSNTKRKVIADIYWKITEPIRKMGREYGSVKFTTIFVGTFILMGVVVLFVLKIIPY
jgi:DNA-binding NtrC family response regulator